METNTPQPTITKTVIYKGVEIRRSNEMTNGQARIHHNPMMWVFNDVAGRIACKTMKEAEQKIDWLFNKYAGATFADFEQNYWKIEVVDGKFTEVTITREEFIPIKHKGQK